MYNSLSDEDKEKIENYSVLQEAEKKLPELEKKLAIQNDTTPPVFSGMEEKEIIKVKYGTKFNLNAYLADKIAITDDISGQITEYYIELDSDVYDNETGDLDTEYYGEFPITLSAKDEAGNERKIALILILDPIHVTKKNPHPTVYDGEYGTVKIKSFKHGEISGKDGYEVVFDVKNDTDQSMIVFLPSSTSINDYQVGAVSTMTHISSGKRGVMDSTIYDSEIPSDIGKYSTIESDVCFKEEWGPLSDVYYSIPIIFDVNVSK